MSYKTYATVGAITLALILTAGVFAPTPALAHHQEGHTANCGSFPESPYCQENGNGGDENTTHILQVNSTNLQGDPITGYFTVIELEGEEVHNGFTPVEFTGDDGATYAVTVHDFEGVTFDHWEDDSTDRTRMVTLVADTTITAYYAVPSGNEEEDEEEENGNGGNDDSGSNGDEHHAPATQGTGLNLALLYKQLHAIWALNGEIPDGQMTASEHYANGFIVYGGYWWAIILMPADGVTPAFDTLTAAQQGYVLELLMSTGF